MKSVSIFLQRFSAKISKKKKLISPSATTGSTVKVIPACILPEQPLSDKEIDAS